MWSKLDDGMPDHPKIRACGLEARWLWIRALHHANKYLTDGKLTADDLAAIADDPIITRPNHALRQLIAAGLLDAVTLGAERFKLYRKGERILPNMASIGRGSVDLQLTSRREAIFVLHDFLVYNKSRSWVLAEREKTAARVGKLRGRNPGNGVTADSGNGVTVEPVTLLPSRPDPINNSLSVGSLSTAEPERNAEGQTFAEYAASQRIPEMLKKLDEKSRPPY